MPGHLDVVGRLNPQDVKCAPSMLDALWGTRSPAKKKKKKKKKKKYNTKNNNNNNKQ